MNRLLACAIALVIAFPASAQNDVPEVTRTYAVTGATVVPAPGQLIDNATIVIRDGLIEAVGAGVSVPPDAVVIRADSLFAYAAFIDGLSHVGIPEPVDDNEPRPDDPGNPGYERAGVQPDRSAAELIEPDHNSIEAHRSAGFATANVVPHGRMLPGSATIATLAPPAPTWLRKDNAMFATFRGGSRVYPGTSVGVMAHYRQLYREAERHQQWQSAYERNPNGLSHPPGDAVLESFFPVIAGTRPVVYHANSALEMQRAVRLKNELGFEVVIAGATEASEIIDQIVATDVPLILSVELPEEEKEEKADTTVADTTAAPPVAFDPTFVSQSQADAEDERENLEARRRDVRQRYLETAAALEKAGIEFGFAGIDVDADEILPNVRKMVEAGLSEEAALAALTTNNARILGVDSAVGTLEAGKLAHVVITDGPLFDEDTKIRYVFVLGHPTEFEASERDDNDDDDGQK